MPDRTIVCDEGIGDIPADEREGIESLGGDLTESLFEKKGGQRSRGRRLE